MKKEEVRGEMDVRGKQMRQDFEHTNARSPAMGSYGAGTANPVTSFQESSGSTAVSKKFLLER